MFETLATNDGISQPNTYAPPTCPELARATEAFVEGKIGRRLEDLGKEVERLHNSIDLLQQAASLGLEMVYPNRQDALNTFAKYLEDYVKRPDSQLFIVASSLKGILAKMPSFRHILYNAKPVKDDKRKQLHILLTHPKHAQFRENQEERAQGDIAEEVFQSIRECEEAIGLGPDDAGDYIKLYKGTPTCFMIATTERMLLNPYPYEKEAYQSFCLTVRDVGHYGSIYQQYRTHHFEEPWTNRRQNTLRYQRYTLEGPNPGERLDESRGPDFFVVQDADSFYLAVFLKGVRGLPPCVPLRANQTKAEEFGEQVLDLGDAFQVKLYRRKDGKLKEEDFDGQCHFHTQQRKGKILGEQKGSFEAYPFVGIFSKDQKIKNPHIQPDAAWVDPELRGKPMPLFWWARPTAGNESNAREKISHDKVEV